MAPLPGASPIAMAKGGPPGIAKANKGSEALNEEIVGLGSHWHFSQALHVALLGSVICLLAVRYLCACLVSTLKSKKVLQYPSYRILRYVHGALNVDEKN